MIGKVDDADQHREPNHYDEQSVRALWPGDDRIDRPFPITFIRPSPSTTKRINIDFESLVSHFRQTAGDTVSAFALAVDRHRVPRHQFVRYRDGEGGSARASPFHDHE